jgi:hypothetical protein
MRLKCRSALGALGVVLALSGVTAASALAIEAPEMVLKGGGTFTTLTMAGVSSPNNPLWEDEIGKQFICNTEGMKLTGVDAKTVTGKITFTGCYLYPSYIHSPGAGEGEIVTEELTGKLVYISKAEKTVGFVFTPKTGTLFTSFLLQGITWPVEGSIILPVGPVNAFRFVFKQLGVSQTGGVQAINKYQTCVKELCLPHSTGLITGWGKKPGSGERMPLGWQFGGFEFSVSHELEIQA